MKIKNISLLFVLLFIVGCGAPRQYRINTDNFIRNDRGVVFGRITTQRFFGLFMYNADGMGTGIGFKNINTGERFTYTGATYFEMMLPCGIYEIDGIGSPSGSLSPEKKPFRFSVKNGEIQYIGSIVGDRDLLRLLEKKNIPKNEAHKEIMSTRKYGPIDFFIIDEDTAVTNEFLKKYPEFSNDKITKNFIE